MQTTVRTHTLLASLLAGIAVFGATSVSFAQKPPASTTTIAAPKEKGHHGENKLMKELGLSADQTKQIKAIQASTKTSVEAVNKDASLTPEQKKTKTKDLRKQSMTKMTAVLTPEQRTKFAELIAQQKAARKAAKKTTASTTSTTTTTTTSKAPKA